MGNGEWGMGIRLSSPFWFPIPDSRFPIYDSPVTDHD
jgi:hypothetical protein